MPGTILPTRDEAGNARYLATSKYTSVEPLSCWSASGAGYYLWVINERLAAESFRLSGTRSVRED